MHQHLTVARVAEGLGVAWRTANDAVLAEGKRVLIARPGRPNDPGRGATGWRWSRWVGLTGFTTAATGGLPDAVAVMGPFHVVGLGGDGLDRCRRRIQRAITGRRGREDDPLHRARPTLRTGAGVLTDKRQDRLEALLAVDARVGNEVAWSVHRRVVAAYRHADRRRGRAPMVRPINSISKAPEPPAEIIALGRTLENRGARRGGAPPAAPPPPQNPPRAEHPPPPPAPPNRRGRAPRNAAARRGGPPASGPAHPTNRPRRSTTASSTYATRHPDPQAPPTTSPDHRPKPADPDPDHTPTPKNPFGYNKRLWKEHLGGAGSLRGAASRRWRR